MRCSLVAVLSLVAAPALAKSDGPKVKPGQWETTVQMEMPGMPAAMPPTVTSSCRTEKDVVPQASQPGQDCKITKQTFTATGVEWAAECKDKSGMTSQMTGKGEYKADSFAGTMQMTMNHGGQVMQMNAKISSKRTGDCKPAAPAKK